MPCPICGEICRCSSEGEPTASPRWQPGLKVCSEAASAVPGTESASEASSNVAAETALPGVESESAPEDSPTWRQEVAARLNRYQSRRKPRPPRYPSLRLRFEEEE